MSSPSCCNTAHPRHHIGAQGHMGTVSNRKSRLSSVIAHLPSPGRAVGTAAGDLAEQLAEQSAGQPAEQLSQLLGRLLMVQPMEKSERLGLPPESGLAPPLEVRQPPEGKVIKTSEAPLACLSLSKSRSSKGESGSGLHAPAGRSRRCRCCSLVSRRRPSAAEIPIFSPILCTLVGRLSETINY